MRLANACCPRPVAAGRIGKHEGKQHAGDRREGGNGDGIVERLDEARLEKLVEPPQGEGGQDRERHDEPDDDGQCANSVAAQALGLTAAA